MAQVNNNILVPYDEYSQLKTDAAAKKSALDILAATFTSDEDKMVALKAVLGYVEPAVPDDESEPDPEQP